MRFLCVILFLATGLCLSEGGSYENLVWNDLNDLPCHPLDLAGKAASVLIFYWQDCPISNGYAPELNRIAASHTNFNFYIVQVDPALTLAAAREHARQYNLQIPVLLDHKHELVKLAAATVTPEVVVLGKYSRVLYRGRIDDGYADLGKKRAAARQHELLDALDAINASRPVKQKETKAVGCLIQ